MEHLREELEKLSKLDTQATQTQRMQELKEEFGHTIQCLENPYLGEPYNCYMYALDVVGAKEITSILRAKVDTLKFGDEFIQLLIDQGIAKPSPTGKLVIYFHKGVPKHGAKKLAGQRMVSKWGLGGLWEHAPFEIPNTYGDSYRIFSVTDKQAIIKAFLTYANRF
jgi:hypothetical protein